MSADAVTGYSPSELRAMSPERLFRVGETTFQQLLALAGKGANAMHPDRVFRLGDPVVQGLLDAAEREQNPAQAKPEKKTEAPAPTPEPAASFFFNAILGFRSFWLSGGLLDLFKRQTLCSRTWLMSTT